MHADWEKCRELQKEILFVAACKLHYIYCSARDDINVLFKKLLSGQCMCIFHNVYVLVWYLDCFIAANVSGKMALINWLPSSSPFLSSDAKAPFIIRQDQRRRGAEYLGHTQLELQFSKCYKQTVGHGKYPWWERTSVFEGPPPFQLFGLILSLAVQICISPLYIHVILITSSTLSAFFMCLIFSRTGVRNHEYWCANWGLSFPDFLVPLFLFS